MVTGQLKDLRANVFSRHFLCCTHATKGIEDAHTKAIRNFDARHCVQEESRFQLFFLAKMKPSQWPASKERMVGVGGREREKKKRRGEKARDAVQWANNYFFKKGLNLKFCLNFASEEQNSFPEVNR